MRSTLPWGRACGFLRGYGPADAGELLHAAKVSLRVRWFVLGLCLAKIHYRIDHGTLSHILNALYCFGLMAANGYVHWLVHRNRKAKPTWLLGLSAMDVATISFRDTLNKVGGNG